MKQFNSEKARAGDPIVTTKGEPARIVCWDRKDDYPIVALVEEAPGQEYVYAAKHTGAMPCGATDYRLYMAPVRREGWLNINPDNEVCLYESEIIADSAAGTGRIACVKVAWEE